MLSWVWECCLIQLFDLVFYGVIRGIIALLSWIGRLGYAAVMRIRSTVIEVTRKPNSEEGTDNENP